jgi:hypothetical protein
MIAPPPAKAYAALREWLADSEAPARRLADALLSQAPSSEAVVAMATLAGTALARSQGRQAPFPRTRKGPGSAAVWRA